MKTLISILFLGILFSNTFADTITEPIRTFTGHTDKVWSVAFSPNGQYAVSGSSTELKLWDVNSGFEIRSFHGHTARVKSVAFSPDSKYVLSGSYDNTLKLWDVNKGTEIRSFNGHNFYVKSVTFSPDGKYALSGSSDDTIKLWDINNGNEIRSFYGHDRWVMSVTFSPDGQYILSGSLDETLKLWDVNSGAEIRSFRGHTWGISSVAFSSDGQYILSSTGNQELKLWDVNSGAEIRSFFHVDIGALSVDFSPDGKYAISDSNKNILTLWDIDNGKQIRSFHGHTSWIESVTFSPDGKYVLSGSDDKTLKLWETGIANNQPPIASFNASPQQGQAPLTVTLDASDSYDPDGTITKYDWSVNNTELSLSTDAADFTVENTSVEIARDITIAKKTNTITFTSTGIYTIVLTVTDNDGLTGTSQKIITVTGNLVPNIRIEPTTLKFDNTKNTRRGFKTSSLTSKDKIVGNESLFIATDFQPKISKPTIARLRYVDINPTALSHDTIYREKVILNLFSDVSYIATNTSINYKTSEHYTWIGKIEELEFGDVTLVVKNGKVTGNINANGTVYRIRPMKDGYHAIQQIDASAFPQYEPTSNFKPNNLITTPKQRRKTRKDDGSIIDVMVVYTQDAAESSSNIEAEIELTIEETNQAYANSNIQQRLRLVHTEQIDYTETGSLSDDLKKLQSTSDSNIDNIHNLRDTHRADLVSFWVEAGDYCGIAPLMTNATMVISFASHGFSVVARHCATAPQYSFSHELGHNMGAHHDTYVATDDGAFDYSHGYVYSTGDSATSWRTILAYSNECSGHGCNRIPHFSNPLISYDENETGNGSSDNRSTLNNTAEIVAAFRQSIISIIKETQNITIYNDGDADLVISSISLENNVPWISISPTNMTISPGTSYSVDVKVNYLSIPIGESSNRLLVNSNDPDENSYPIDINVNRHPDTAGDKQELKDAVFAQNTGELSIAIEVPDVNGQMELSNATLSLVNSALVFQLNNISSLTRKPPGNISSYDPLTTNVNIPIVNVPDEQGNPQLFKVTMQPIPSEIDQTFWFQVTEAVRVEVPIVE